jgi:uncharacterized protein YjbI with pentapeptide repeats
MRAAAPSPSPPRLPPLLERARLAGLAHDQVIGEAELAGDALPDQHARGVSFDTVLLTAVDLSGSALEHLRVADAELRDCNLANVRARQARIANAVFGGCRMTGVDLGEAVVRDVTLRGCRIDLASFSAARMERVSFEECVLEQTDFLEARLDGVRFHACALAGADLRGARLDRCELRGNQMDGVQGVASLRGAAMEWGDIVGMAGAFAAALGVEVLDAD